LRHEEALPGPERPTLPEGKLRGGEMIPTAQARHLTEILTGVFAYPEFSDTMGAIVLDREI